MTDETTAAAVRKALHNALLVRRRGDDADIIADGIDPARFVDADGQVDTEAIKTFTTKHFGEARPRDFGQGVRTLRGARRSGVEVELERRFGKRDQPDAQPAVARTPGQEALERRHGASQTFRSAEAERRFGGRG